MECERGNLFIEAGMKKKKKSSEEAFNVESTLAAETGQRVKTVFFLFQLRSDIFLNLPELGCLCDTKLLMKSSHGRRDW